MQALLSEIILLSAATGMVLIAAFFPKKKADAMNLRVMLLALLASMVSVMHAEMMHAPKAAFGGLFLLSPMAALLKLLAYGLTLGVCLFVHAYLKKRNIPVSEFYILMMFSLLGVSTLASSRHLLVLYLGLELMSLPLYALVALRKKDMVSSEAAMKYFTMGAIASGMLLYGISLLYGAVHVLDLGQIAAAIPSLPKDSHWVVSFGLVFILLAVLFKFGAAPFHLWVPDVYEGAPASVVLFLSSVSKIGAFALLYHLIWEALHGFSLQWTFLLNMVALFSIAFGNFAALSQQKLRRLLAYSGIAHMGYLLLGLVPGTASGLDSALFYLLTYALLSLGSFGFLTIVLGEGLGIRTLDDLQGLNRRDPAMALVLLILLFGMAGIPPMVGFWAKLGVIQALIAEGAWRTAGCAMLLAVVGAYYYLRVVRVMYFDAPLDTQPEGPLMISKFSRLLLKACAFFVLYLGIFPGALLRLCHWV